MADNETASKFRKKPVVIEAMRVPANSEGTEYEWGELAGWLGLHNADFMVEAIRREDGGGHAIQLRTLEGTMLASPGDYIIRGVAGEFYPCKPDIFEATYDLHVEPGEEACEACQLVLPEESMNHDSEGVPLCDSCWEEFIESCSAEVGGGAVADDH